MINKNIAATYGPVDKSLLENVLLEETYYSVYPHIIIPPYQGIISPLHNRPGYNCLYKDLIKHKNARMKYNKRCRNRQLLYEKRKALGRIKRR